MKVRELEPQPSPELWSCVLETSPRAFALNAAPYHLPLTSAKPGLVANSRAGCVTGGGSRSAPELAAASASSKIGERRALWQRLRPAGCFPEELQGWRRLRLAELRSVP